MNFYIRIKNSYKKFFLKISSLFLKTIVSCLLEFLIKGSPLDYSNYILIFILFTSSDQSLINLIITLSKFLRQGFLLVFFFSVLYLPYSLITQVILNRYDLFTFIKDYSIYITDKLLSITFFFKSIFLLVYNIITIDKNALASFKFYY